MYLCKRDDIQETHADGIEFTEKDLIKESVPPAVVIFVTSVWDPVHNKSPFSSKTCMHTKHQIPR